METQMQGRQKTVRAVLTRRKLRLRRHGSLPLLLVKPLLRIQPRTTRMKQVTACHSSRSSSKPWCAQASR